MSYVEHVRTPAAPLLARYARVRRPRNEFSTEPLATPTGTAARDVPKVTPRLSCRGRRYVARTAQRSFAAEARRFENVSSFVERITAVGNFGEDASSSARLKGFLHPAVFARMKREHGHAAAWRETLRQRSQQRVERGELVVHRNADRLERAPHRHLHVGLFQVRQCLVESDADHALEGVRRRDRRLLDQAAMSPACGSSALSVRSDASASSLRRSSSCDAGSPCEGFIRMSSGPGW